MPIPLPFHLTDFVGREDDVADQGVRNPREVLI
jgi:hypothetical protein